MGLIFVAPRPDRCVSSSAGLGNRLRSSSPPTGGQQVENLNVADESKRKDHTKKQYAVTRDSARTCSTRFRSRTAHAHLFAICVDKCPSRGDWVCTDAVPNYKTTAMQTKLDACKASVGGGQFLSLRKYTGAEHQDCAGLMAKCWQIPTQSVSFLFRCMYDYNFTTTQTQERICVDPPGVPPTSENCAAVMVYRKICPRRCDVSDFTAGDALHRRCEHGVATIVLTTGWCRHLGFACLPFQVLRELRVVRYMALPHSRHSHLVRVYEAGILNGPT